MTNKSLIEKEIENVTCDCVDFKYYKKHSQSCLFVKVISILQKAREELRKKTVSYPCGCDIPGCTGDDVIKWSDIEQVLGNGK